MNLRHFASLTGIQLLVADPIVYRRMSNLTLCGTCVFHSQ